MDEALGDHWAIGWVFKTRTSDRQETAQGRRGGKDQRGPKSGWEGLHQVAEIPCGNLFAPLLWLGLLALIFLLPLAKSDMFP